MINEATIEEFAEVKLVVADTLKFKVKLGIGEDAYTSLKVARGLQTIWDLKNAATIGAAAASSPLVVSTFFSGGGGLLSTLGFGAAAATPVAWILAAAVASGGAYYGVMRLASGYASSRVASVPKFINTPIDLLGATLFDLIGGLALKVAAFSNGIDQTERKALLDYFSDEWGLSKDYMAKAIPIIENEIAGKSLKEMTRLLAEFQIDNSDCNPSFMKRDIINLLGEIVQADGEIDEREELAIETVERELNNNLSLHSQLSKKSRRVANSAADNASKAFAILSNQTSKMFKRFKT